MPEPLVEGLIQTKDERKDSELRDVAAPLRAARPGGIIVPRRMVVELQLRPGTLIEGEMRGRALHRVTKIEGTPINEY